MHSVQQFKVHDAAGGSVYKSSTLKDLQDNIKADSPNSLCIFVLIGLVVLIFGIYWSSVQLVSCNANLDRAHEAIANITQQLDDMTKAKDEIAKEKERADKSAQDTEKELKKQLDDMTKAKDEIAKAKERADKSAQDTEKELKHQLEQLKQQLNTKNNELAAKDKKLNKFKCG